MSYNEVVQMVADFGAWLKDRGTAHSRADALEAGLLVYRTEGSPAAGLEAAKTAFESDHSASNAHSALEAAT